MMDGSEPNLQIDFEGWGCFFLSVGIGEENAYLHFFFNMIY